ncbi:MULTISPECIES: sigma 54-interacting transcriptional regulator [unclassified Enterococcus]|uniref:sigma 54-interacting transcriptional regulator n=1 Tax=unclassified Enterococcus TaxID=2608891 RepID=UPI0013EBF926|nr:MULTISPECIES: sigma 54-interacting transcriptional regulator [unclassified Enterococcus]
MNEAVFHYLKQKTKEYAAVDPAVFSAQRISEAIQLNRSTVSGYLNQGYKAGELIKIKEYPVLFLHRETFANCFFSPKKNAYDSLEELMEESGKKEESPLENVIGAKGSLKEQIEQIKTAVLYPENGLPIMLHGASGSGKSYLARKIYEYAVYEKVVKEDAPFLSLNCAQYFNNPELLSSLLFGYAKGAFTGAEQNKPGLLAAADQGVLFLDEVHRLTEEGQEKLFSFMDTGKYTPVGDDGDERKATVRFIFATTEDLQMTFLPTFLRRLPVIIGLPSFQDRSHSERLRLIDSFFLAESAILERELHISKKVIQYLQHADFEGNVGKIKNIVKYTCASAYARKKEHTEITVTINDLPHDCFVKTKESYTDQYRSAPMRSYAPNMDLGTFLHSEELVRLSRFFTDLLDNFRSFENKELTTAYFIDSTIREVVLLMDEFVFHPVFSQKESAFSFLTYHIRSTFSYMAENYGFEQDGNRVLAIATYLYLKDDQMLFGEHLQWQTSKKRLLQFLDEYMEETLWLGKQLLEQLSSRMERPFLEEDLIFVTFYLHSFSPSKITSKIKAVVLAHGYSTASSLANVANRLLKKNLFQAFDMPIDISLAEVEEQVLRYIENYRTQAGLILLVDMGSLNQLSSRLSRYLSGPLLIIDSVSTPIVLEIGEALLKDQTLDEIYQTIQLEDRIHKQFVLPQRKKRKAILTCCYTGMGSAVQIQEILAKSIGEAGKDLSIIPYDYHKLKTRKQKEMPFQLYDILAIVGTEDPEVDGVLYIGLDHLVSGEKVEQFIELLEKQLPINAGMLKEELVFHFSLKKIVENLVILDAEKVLGLVKKAVGRLEKMLQIHLSSNRRFLLYLHSCCMIERILRKEKIDPQDDLEEYMQQEKTTLEAISYSFNEIEREYTITLSDLELRLLSEIILGEGE